MAAAMALALADRLHAKPRSRHVSFILDLGETLVAAQAVQRALRSLPLVLQLAALRGDRRSRSRGSPAAALPGGFSPKLRSAFPVEIPLTGTKTKQISRKKTIFEKH